MSIEPIYIAGVGSISSLGSSSAVAVDSLKSGESKISLNEIGGEEVPVAALTSDSNNELLKLQSERKSFSELDRTNLLAIHASREAFANSKWTNPSEVGVIIGSSRGATAKFETCHAQFIEKHKLPPLTSPLTTQGNISSWVAQDLMLDCVAVSHSVTCSTALHSIGNALAWINSGMCDSFLVGGSEAPLTPFTLAQMKALRIYSSKKLAPFCKPCDSDNQSENTLVLGEGAAVFAVCTEKKLQNKPIAKIVGFGCAQEQIASHTHISPEGDAFCSSMARAKASMKDPKSIDLLVMHAPGTKLGDDAELSAIKTVFDPKLPILTSNKWIVGHTFGASGAMSLEYAIYCLQSNSWIELPFDSKISNSSCDIKTVMINAAGFGGNAVSIIVSL